MVAKVSDLEFRHTTNGLGGVITATDVLSQNASALTNVTGVTIDDAHGNALGNGTLRFFATAVKKVEEIILDAALVTGNNISIDVDGVTVDQDFVTNSNTTLANFATKIALEAGVDTAVVTDAGAGTDDDRVIVVTSAVAGTPAVLQFPVVSGGASQAGVTLSITTGNQTADSINWEDDGSGKSDGVDISISGEYGITSRAGGGLTVTVVSGSLPGTNQTDSDVAITNRFEEVYDDWEGDESFNGATRYYCVYVFNKGSVDTMFNVKVAITKQPSGADSLEIGLDPAGVGDGASTGVAATIASETTAPSGVTFTAPATKAAALIIGNLGPGKGQAIWLKGIMPANNLTASNEDNFHIEVWFNE